MTDTFPAPPAISSEIGYSTHDAIFVRGNNLATDLMGHLDFGSMFYLLVTGRRPDAAQAEMFNACLVALADHGLTPSAIAARLTLLAAPDAVQGAIAAGILGAGPKFLGVFEDAGRMLHTASPTTLQSDAEFEKSAGEIVADYRSAGRLLPGLGHPIHKDGDPRTSRLYELAKANGTYGPYMKLLEVVREAAEQATGRALPINAAGACGAVLCDIGLPVDVLRGVAVVSRAAGLVGHVAEEQQNPIAEAVWFGTEHQADSSRAPHSD
jgi:citrate synthase